MKKKPLMTFLDTIDNICRGKETVIFGKNPFVLIFGEFHEDLTSAQEQVQVVVQLQPEIVVHEFLRSYMLDIEKKELAQNPAYPPSPEVKEFLKRKLLEGEYPSRELMPELLEWSQACGVKIKLNAYESGFFGLGLEETGLYVHLTNIPRNVKLYVGCDLSTIETRFLEEQLGCKPGEGIGSIHSPPELELQRETRMGNVIAAYTKKTDKPLIAVMGAYHTREESAIHPILRKEGIAYAIVNQNDYREGT